MSDRHHGALPPVRILTTIAHLEWLAERLSGETRLAVDMESDGFYAYHEKVCLIQISSQKEDYIVDPIAAKDISPLAPILRDPHVEKVFHAAEYDILSLKRDFGFAVHGLFDTMAAARTLGAPRLGLAPLIEEHFSVTLSKKLQRANWGKRPLSPEQIEYARLDTHYLIRLRDILEKKLREKSLLEEAREAFRRLERKEPAEKTFDPDAFWRLPGAKDLSGQARAVLKELYVHRERTASELNSAAFRVMPEPLLVRLAQSQPEDLAALEKAPGMTSYLYKRYGEGLLEAIRRGRSQPPIEEPPAREPRPGGWDNATARRYEAVRAWRKKLAEERGVNPVVILETPEVRALAEAPRKNEDPSSWTCCLSEYKRGLYGEDLKRVLSAPLPPGAPGKSRRRRRR